MRLLPFLLPTLVWLVFSLGSRSVAQETQQPAIHDRAPGPIQDNSFLIEEAYNQEDSVIQHISYFQKLTNTGAWVYTQTDEWPLRSYKHQLSVTLVGNAHRRFSGCRGRLGRYRHQLQIPTGRRWGSETGVCTATELVDSNWKLDGRARIRRLGPSNQLAGKHSTFGSLGHALERWS